MCVGTAIWVRIYMILLDFQTGLATRTSFWRPEVGRKKNAPLPGENVVDCLDIYARVICSKLQALLGYDINEKGFEGFKAHFRVDEFQKKATTRTLIFFLSPESITNLEQPSFLGTIIYSELPSADSLQIFQVVLKHNNKIFEGMSTFQWY